MSPVTSDELIEEKNLRQVYLASRRISVSRFNQWTTGAVFMVLATFAYLTPEATGALAERTRVIADYGFNFATSILSFLIAGFTIYITITKSELLLFLASEREAKSGLPWIKFIAFHFLRVMALYVVFCVLCASIKLFASAGGPLTLMLDIAFDNPASTKAWLARIGFASIGAILVHMILLLQSFIYNIYHSAMLAICWERSQVTTPPVKTKAL